MLFVLNYVFLLIFADKSLKHHFHCIELTVSKTSHQVNLTKATDGQTFTDLIFF